ncbi:MAG: MmgE/PrpD family protein, partial [Pseudomonadota bacterium]
MSTASVLARFAVSATPDMTVADIARPAVADCFGAILAGADSDVAQRVRTALGPFSEGGVAVYGTQQTLSAPNAALVNAIAGHAWDLDDWEEPGNTHPTVVLLPALLAMAHLHPTSGRQLLAAYAVGAEIIMRLGEAVTLDHYARGFHSTATLGAIGAAGTVARLIGLSADKTAHAMALATSQATGYTVQFGSNAKPLQAGLAARAGVEAACLAASGVTAQASVIDDPRGFSGLMGAHSPARFRRLPARLGAPWALAEYGLVMKPWPSCGYTHRLMTAALDLRAQRGGETGEITEIHAVMPDFHHAILPFVRPASRNEALFSAPACIAQALAAGRLTLVDIASGFWTTPEVGRLIGITRVTSEPARDMSLNYDPAQPDRLSVTLGSGETIHTSCVYPLGA